MYIFLAFVHIIVYTMEHDEYSDWTEISLLSFVNRLFFRTETYIVYLHSNQADDVKLQIIQKWTLIFRR